MIKLFYSFFLLFLLAQGVSAGHAVLIHSHNDYLQPVPFYTAYSAGLDSYEADVFYNDSTRQVWVAHEAASLRPDNTLEALYFGPMAEQLRRRGGKITDGKPIVLLVDIKDDYQRTLPAVLALAGQYASLFKAQDGSPAVQLVFTGNIPLPDQFANYPSVCYFDGNPALQYSPGQLARVAFFSDSFQRYAQWNGKGSPLPTERAALQQLIDSTHHKGKMLRFWGCPDNLNSWQTFRGMGVDMINTDRPAACAAFFDREGEQQFQFGATRASAVDTVVKVKKLDAATRNFSGFNAAKQTLAAPVAIYQPTGRNDGAQRKAKNVILLIGDGMGLTQLSAADLINGGLCITRLKYLGLQRTQSASDFITDSAGAGSALATGEKTNNRAIAVDGKGNPRPSLTDRMHKAGKACGIVTNGHIADATPAVFYGHTPERDRVEEITARIPLTQPEFLAGSGAECLSKRSDGRNLIEELQPMYQLCTAVEQPSDPRKKTLLLDERLEAATTADNLHLLAASTRKAIEHLKTDADGFFLMVEGAKIDYAGHANCFPSSILETLGFDLAVQEALRFADSNGETLVVVTADHETGGLSLVGGNVGEGRISGVYATDDHSPVMVPVYAYGPGAAGFCGVYNNTDIFWRILQATK